MEQTPKIKFGQDRTNYADIMKKDRRYDTRAYDFVLRAAEEASERANGHVTGGELLDAFRELALDAYGPLAYTALTDWGLRTCEDVGEVVFNLVESGRLGKRPTDSRADFIGGYSFEEEFLDPYKAP